MGGRGEGGGGVGMLGGDGDLLRGGSWRDVLSHGDMPSVRVWIGTECVLQVPVLELTFIVRY
jgi:hypothetical protein